MSDFIKIFSNRELSLIIWLSFFIVLVLFSKKIRSGLFSVVGSLFNKSFLFLYLWIISYMILIIIPLYLFDLWRISDLKNTIIWLFTVGFVLIFSAITSKDSSGYIKRIFISTLKWSIILDFIINFYNFNLLIELLIFSILITLVLLQTVAEKETKYILVSKFINTIFAIIGFTILVFFVYRLSINYKLFVNVNTLISFTLPIILSILFIPLIYFIAIYSTYSGFFKMKRYILKEDNELYVFLKKLVIRKCNISLKKIKLVSKELQIYTSMDKTNIIDDLNMVLEKNKYARK